MNLQWRTDRRTGVETLQLALDDRRHTGSEYAAVAARGVVAGAASGLLGAAVTGALAGSVAPGVGTAIGFVVGVGTYMLVNWLLSQTPPASFRSASGPGRRARSPRARPGSSSA